MAAAIVGTEHATKRVSFLVASTKPETVVLRIYGDRMICASFNRITRQVEPNFVLLKVAEDPRLRLRLEPVGPLHVKIR